MKRLKELCIKDRTIKLPCLLSFSVIFLGMICAATPTYAEIIACNSTTVVEITQSEDCPDCPPPPDCPPVLACDVGYSCQKDDLPPPPGERQQYPPSVAAAWVATLGCSNLTDVALDDSRWGNREVGEVFIQENDKCVSIYWPSGGEALFDLSATLSNPAEWNDYLFSSNRPPGGGNYTIGNGKEKIRFNDGGTGGMTVFVAGTAPPPPPPPPPTGMYIQPYSGNTAYWQYKGKPIVLKGSAITNSLVSGVMGWWFYYESKDYAGCDGCAKHVTPDYLGWNKSLNYGSGNTGTANFEGYKNAIREEFRLLAESGGNYTRLTLADYSGAWIAGGEDDSLQPFIGKLSKHNFDLNKWNDEWWKRLDFVFAEAERRGIIIQVEIWDGWDLGSGTERFKNIFWHPNNNVNYNNSSLKVSFTGRENNPLRKVWVDSDKSNVLGYMKKYIARVLQYAGKYNNLIFEIENENPASIKDWSNPWADFIHANNPYNRPVHVTDMVDGYDLAGTRHTTIKNDTTRFQYLDASQHSRRMHVDNQKYNGYYNDVYNFVKNLGSKKRPVNIAKIYSSFTPPNTWTNQYSPEHGINYYFANIFAGTSGSRYHRPAQNKLYVSPKEARKTHRAITWMVNTVGNDFFTMLPYHYKDAFTGRDHDGVAYARKGNGKYVVFFDKWEQQVFLKVANGTYKVQWYNNDTSTIKNAYIKNITNGLLEINKSHGGLSATNRGVIVISKDGVTPPPPPPPTGDFLDNYTNPDQSKVPADDIYPIGQRMPIGFYSGFGSNFTKPRDAGIPITGIYYMGTLLEPYQWKSGASAGQKGMMHLRLPKSGLSGGIEYMKTAEGKAIITSTLKKYVAMVQDDPALNDYINFWYAGWEEPMMHKRNAEEIAFMKFAHAVVAKEDKRKRPLYVSERGDSGHWLMKQTQCGQQDGVLKQDYLIANNPYSPDNSIRMRMWKWSRDVIDTAALADKECPSYTGKSRAAIATLSAYHDPNAASEQNATWLRKVITYDIYVSLVGGKDKGEGVTGFFVYDFVGSKAPKTGSTQRNIYTEYFSKFIKDGLGKVFVWGDDRFDVTKKILSGPTTVKWATCCGKHDIDSSIFLRNIQYGNNRYILLTNNSKESVKVELTGVPKGLKLTNMLTGSSMTVGSIITPTIETLGVRLYKISK